MKGRPFERPVTRATGPSLIHTPDGKRRPPLAPGQQLKFASRARCQGAPSGASLTKHSTCVLRAQLVRDICPGQAYQFGERCIRPAGATRQRRDQARDRGVTVAIERAQVDGSGSGTLRLFTCSLSIVLPV
jgi:hypothetical protein